MDLSLYHTNIYLSVYKIGRVKNHFVLGNVPVAALLNWTDSKSEAFLDAPLKIWEFH